jgi:Fe-S cluster biosynthesis and repair protein YggX
MHSKVKFMPRKVKCAKLGIEAEGLDTPPFPGPEGQRIYEHISKQAWQEWLKLQTMLINEYRLTVFEPEAKEFLAQEREKFLFGGAAQMPEGYVPPKSDQEA